MNSVLGFLRVKYKKYDMKYAFKHIFFNILDLRKCFGLLPKGSIAQLGHFF